MVRAPAPPDHMLEMSLEMVLNMHPLVCEHVQIKSASSAYNQVVEQVNLACSVKAVCVSNISEIALPK